MPVIGAITNFEKPVIAMMLGIHGLASVAVSTPTVTTAVPPARHATSKTPFVRRFIAGFQASARAPQVLVTSLVALVSKTFIARFYKYAPLFRPRRGDGLADRRQRGSVVEFQAFALRL